jgi:hypothetical protein
MRLQHYRYSATRRVQKIKTKTAIAITAAALAISGGGGLSLAILGTTHADSAAVNFEPPAYSVGNINGQNGWSKTGGYDAVVVANTYGYSTFGTQSLRISNSVTSGSFGDQTFSPPLAQQAGETNAFDKNGSPVASPLPRFEAQFDLASTTKSEQPGMALSVSPDNGSGARMSYLRFEDQTDGVHVFFDDVTDPTHAVNADTFNENDIATLSYAVPHTVKFSIDFHNGPDNDVVKIYIDGSLATTGTSWEDYYLFDTESNPVPQNNNSRTVSSLLFREGGTAVPANAGNGYLIDSLSLVSGAIPSSAPTDKDQCKGDGWKSLKDANGNSFKNQGACVSYVASNGKSAH